MSSEPSQTQVEPGERPLRLLERSTNWLAAAALFALSWRYMDLLGDSFWSVATGRFILEHGSLPVSDPFSFTANHPWIVHMPLSQILLAWIEGHFGILALELFGTLVFGASLLALWLPHARGMLARPVVYPLLVLLVFLQKDDLCVRGQIFGDLAFAVLLACGFRLRLGQRVHPVLASLLASLWINLHSSAPLCVVVPLAWATLLRFEPASRRPPLRPYLVFATAAAFGLFLNPYGVHLVADVLRLFASSNTRTIDLFMPPDFASPLTLVTFFVLLLSVAWCVRRPLPQAGAGLSEALLLIIFVIASAAARRYLPLALGFSIVILARRTSVTWSYEPRLVSWLAFASVALGTTVWGLSIDKDPWQNVPLEEVSMIEKLQLPDHVAHNYHWGGFLDYAWNGRRKVFIDGRNQLFEHGAFEDSVRLARLEGWQEVLDRYRVNTVLWERNAPLDLALAGSPNWQQVGRGALAALYVRKQPIPLDVAAGNE